MKKTLSLILALVMALSLVACGGGNTTPNSDGSNTGDSTELVFAHIFATDSMEDKCAKMFAEKVAEYTKGAYTVTVYPAGQLGAMAEIIEQQQVGTATFQIISTTALSSISEYAAVDSWPYMFTNREEFEKAYASDAGKEWLTKVSEETGFTLLAPMYKGIRQTFVNFDAETIDDLKGCKLRVAGLQPVLDCFTCMGVYSYTGTPQRNAQSNMTPRACATGMPVVMFLLKKSSSMEIASGSQERISSSRSE